MTPLAETVAAAYLRRPRHGLRFAAGLSALLAVAACVATVSSHPPPSPVAEPNAPSGWTRVFADEFTTPGPPDPVKWNYEIGYVRNAEAQFYTSDPQNVRVEGGTLIIEARRERHGGFAYTSASVTTKDRMNFVYGRFEVRAKLPSGRGTWPAIWLLGSDIDKVGWPECGEIDIMEHVGHQPARIYGTVHTPAYNHVLGTQKGSSIDVPALWQDFHVYALEWHKDRLDFFVDDIKYFTFKKEDGGNAVWPFDRPFYLLINLAIGGSWGGERGIDDGAFPHRYVIDYVRVYRYSGLISALEPNLRSR